jgi:hypothetical protein
VSGSVRRHVFRLLPAFSLVQRAELRPLEARSLICFFKDAVSIYQNYPRRISRMSSAQCPCGAGKSSLSSLGMQQQQQHTNSSGTVADPCSEIDKNPKSVDSMHLKSLIKNSNVAKTAPV